MRNKQKIWLGLIICASFWACQDSSVKAPQSFSLTPELRVFIDSNAVDSSLGIHLKVPFQSMDEWSKDSLQSWVSAQNQYSTSGLKTDNDYFSYYGDQQIIGFPKKVNNAYYALANFKGKRGIYKGSDLSTLSTYQPFLLDSAINLPEYQIKDFVLLDSSAQQLALLLYLNQTHEYRAAFYNFQEDSITLWANLNIRPEWQVKDRKIWVHSPQDSLIIQIQVDQPEILTYALETFQQSPINFLAVLDSNLVLIKVKEKAGQTSYYQLSNLEKPQKIFTFSNSQHQWLGFYAGKHYFQADFKSGRPQIFSYQSNPNQDLLKTITPTDDTTLIHTQIIDSTIICLHYKLGYSELRKYTLNGQLLSTIPLTRALTSIDFNHYSKGNHTLVRQLSPEDGLRWLNVDTLMPTIVEPVYRSLIPKAQVPFSENWQWIRSYDGTPFPIVIYAKPSNTAFKKRRSLVIPISSDLEAFRKQLIDLAVVNRSLQSDVIVIFLLPRGNRQLGQKWHLKGTGPQLQLAYDDLQACITYLNEKAIGGENQRSVWGIQEGALSAAALLMQRPELTANIVLQEGIYDLRTAQSSIHQQAWHWINTTDSLSNRLSIKYSPQFYPIRPALYPNCLVQTSNQSIFAPPLQSLKWVARLQNIPGAQTTYLYTENKDTVTRKWEQMVWNFINQ